MRWCGVITACSLVLGTFTSGCIAADDLQPFDASRVTLLQLEPLLEGEDIAVVTTDEGQFRMRFFPSEAPLAVQNFICLAREGFYNDKTLTAHSIDGDEEPQALIPEVEPVSRVEGGKPFELEVSANLWHLPGAVSVLGNRRGRGDSRFFITGSREVPSSILDELAQQNYPAPVIEQFRLRGGAPEYSLEFPVFAQVVEGLDVVDTLLSRLERGESGVTIQSVTVVVYKKEAAE